VKIADLMVSGRIDGAQSVLASGEAIWLAPIIGGDINTHDPLTIRRVVDTLDAIIVSHDT